jgi:ABC-type antimicrobial peptide transport system permease subunit
MHLLVRTKTDVPTIGDALRRELRALDARVPLHDVTTMDDELAHNFAQPRLRTQLLGAFAGLGLLLAALGTYGLLTRGVVQRTRELGIRMALGATAARILRELVVGAMRPVLGGLVVGLVATGALVSLLRGFLFGVEPHDPLTLLAAAGGLSLIALAANALAARRSSRASPALALQSE